MFSISLADVERIATTFGINDRDGLELTLYYAQVAYTNSLVPELADPVFAKDNLLQFAKQLEKAASYLGERDRSQVNWSRLDTVLRSGASDTPAIARCEEALSVLARLADAARRAHRSRRRGQPRQPRLAAAVEVLFDYWRLPPTAEGNGGGLGRDFTTVGEWIDGAPRKRSTRGPHFIAECMELIAPGARGVESILREKVKAAMEQNT
jgi:hypothetical protein